MSIADKLTTIADNQQKVYDAGRHDEWSDFWDAFQDKGKRTQYKHAFTGFTNEIFKPKYDIIFPNKRPRPETDGVFFGSRIKGSYTQMLEDLDRVIDFTKSTSIHETFGDTTFTEITLYAPSAQTGYGTFGWSYELEVINLTVSDSFEWNSTFETCPKLKNLTIGSKITKNGFSVSTCTKLTHDSLMSIINALADKTGDTSKTWKVTLGSTNVAKLTEEELQLIKDKGWTYA